MGPAESTRSSTCSPGWICTHADPAQPLTTVGDELLIDDLSADISDRSCYVVKYLIQPVLCLCFGTEWYYSVYDLPELRRNGRQTTHTISSTAYGI